LAAFAEAAPVRSADEAVDTTVTIISVHEEPAGAALPGIHLQAKLNGRMSDIYLAPARFLEELGMSFRIGEDVYIVGSRTKVGGVDVVLAREIAAAGSQRRTLYLRDEHGPLWDEKPAAVANKGGKQ
jgi:hypothetical protein